MWIVLQIIKLLCCAVALPFNKLTASRSIVSRGLNLASHAALTSMPPSSPKAQLRFSLRGPAVNSSQFRAEIRKELSFYRGCNVTYQQTESEAVVVVAEGKTNQLVRFTSWLSTLELDILKRKRSFQSPYLVANVSELEWNAFDAQGCLEKGFVVMQQ